MRIVITALLINMLIIPSTMSGSFEGQEQKKYIGSGFGQVFGPAAVIGTVKALENFIKKHKPEANPRYVAAKEEFIKNMKEFSIGNWRAGENLVDGAQKVGSRIKANRFTYIGYTVWPGFTRVSFIGIPRAFNIPGLVAWLMTQLFTQENQFIPKAIQKALGLQKGMIETMLPDKLPSLDFNVKDYGRISAYVENGKIRVSESIYSTEKSFIVGQPVYSADGISAEIQLDRHRLKLFPDEPDRITISLRPSSTSKARNINIEDFVIKSGSYTWKGADNTSKAAPMIWDLGVNAAGRNPKYNRLKPLTSFIFESGGRGYTVPLHHMLDKLLRIGIGTGAAWPMLELGRQVWSSGMVNLGVHLLTSYDVLFAFMLGGITGKAVGSRTVDMAVLAGAKIDRALMNKFPALKRTFNTRKEYKQLNSCRDFLGYILRPPLRGRSDLSMDVVRSVLWGRYGKVYEYGTLALAGYGCGLFASGLTERYRNAKEHVLDIFAPLEEENPYAPYDLSGFPPEGADERAITPSQPIDPESENVSVLGAMTEIVGAVTPSFGMSAQANMANAEQVYNQENGIEENQLSLDHNTLSQLYDMQAESATSAMAEYEENPEAFHELLWLTYLMTQPIKEIQESYLEKVEEATASNEPIVELKKVLYEFLEDFDQGQHKRSLYKAFENEFKNSGGLDMTGFMAEKIASFIALSDVLIFATQYTQAAQDYPNPLGGDQ